MSDDAVEDIQPGPERITLYICDRCERTEFASNAIKPGHYSRGDRCGGTVHPVVYEKQAKQL